jgi:hypothetical protein
MKPTKPLQRRHRRSAWVLGFGVLAALACAVVWMLERGAPLAAKLVPADGAAQQRSQLSQQSEQSQRAPLSQQVPELGVGAAVAPTKDKLGPVVRGIVKLPGGEPAQGASVSVKRARTAWPEWQSEQLDRVAITGRDGVFQFRFADANGLLVEFEHPQFAGGLVEVTRPGELLELQLEPGFELYGVVTNDAGVPLGNARVALESVPGDNRRVRVETTTADGRYRFTRLPAGPVRLVARHQDWQPTSQPAVVVGDQRRIEVRFDRPAMAPLRGRVTSAHNASPIADALVQLLPLNGKLGLVDPVATRTGPEGAFVLTGLARGSMRLLVRHADHGAVIRTETVGVVSTGLQIELPRRTAVSGELVVDRGTAPWRGGEILQLRDFAGQVAFAVIGTDGRFRFDQPLSPGWGSMRALADPFAFQRSYTTQIDVRLEEHEATELELTTSEPAIVRGRIVDDKGQPLAGVQLTRTLRLAENARTIGDAATHFDLEAVRNQVAQLFASDRDELLATSGADGTFAIRGLKPGPLSVRASLRGRGSRFLRVGITGFQPSTDLGSLPMAAGCQLQGRVLRGGRPLAGAAVLVTGDDAEAMVITDAGGVWRVDDLPPGDYRVRARLPSQPLGTAMRNVAVSPEKATTNVMLQVETGRTVRGTVTGSNEQPVAGAVVTVRGSLGNTVATDNEGAFLLELPERATELQVALADRSQAKIVPVPPGDERLLIRLDTPPTCTIAAQVAGLPGKKRTGSALLRLTRLDAVREETRSRWLELPDGALRWPFCPTGHVRIEIQCDGYAPFVVERELVANEEHFLEVLLEPGARLVGEVRAPDGSPVANAVVMLGDESDLDLFEAGTRTLADGSFRLSGVTGRSSRVVVRSAGYAPREVELSLPRDVLSPRPLRIDLEPGSTIEVKLPEAALRDGGLVQLRRDGRFVASGEADESGRVWFANRSAGTYTGGPGSSDDAPRQVVVPPGVPVVQVQL